MGSACPDGGCVTGEEATIRMRSFPGSHRAPGYGRTSERERHPAVDRRHAATLVESDGIRIELPYLQHEALRPLPLRPCRARIEECATDTVATHRLGDDDLLDGSG